MSESTLPVEKKHHHIFRWVFLAIQLVFLIWIIAGVASVGSSPADCGTLTAEQCNAATGIGATIGAGLIVAFWLAVDFILGITYMIFHWSRRPAR